MADELRIYVINLPSAQGRRRLMEAQLQQPGVPGSAFIVAVDGRQLSEGERAQRYDDARALQDSGRALGPGEIGCALSHQAALGAIAEGDLVAGVVLEDDAVFGAESLAVMMRLLPYLRSPDPRLVLLEHVARYSAWGGLRIGKHHRLFRPTKTRGAHAYMVNPAGARALLAAQPRISVVADNWAYFARHVDIRAVVPYCVGRGPASHDSQIGPAGARRTGAGLKARLRKLFYDKLAYQLIVRPLRRIRVQKETW